MIRTLSAIGISLAIMGTVSASEYSELFERLTTKTPLDATLVEKATASGPIRVLVGLKVTTDGTRWSVDDVQQTQASLLKSLPSESVTLHHLYRHIPYIAMSVDDAALKALDESDLVSHVLDDLELAFDLDESRPLVGVYGSPQSDPPDEFGLPVVVIDTGIDAQHPFLRGRVLREACFSVAGCPNGLPVQFGPGAASPCSLPGCFHGTTTTGVAAGAGGIAPDAGIIAIRTVQIEETLLYEIVGLVESDLLAALDFVIDILDDTPVGSINLSANTQYGWGGVCDGEQPSFLPMLVATQILWSQGVPLIVSSSNRGRLAPNVQMGFPACLSTTISVGATDDDREVTASSSSGDNLDFLAPGDRIRTSTTGDCSGGCFAEFSGTSYASPHVAAAWAVLRDVQPTATTQQIYDALVTSAIIVTDPRQNRNTPFIQLDEAKRTLDPPTVTLYPDAGRYVAPLELELDTRFRGSAEGIAVWMSTDGSEPAPDAAASNLVCEGYGCNFTTINLDTTGDVEVRATPFVTLRNGTTISGPSVVSSYELTAQLPGPLDVQASDGLYPDRVRIKWSPLSGAQHYDVLAGLAADGPFLTLNNGPLLDTVYDHIVEDGTGQTLYYSVRAVVDGLPTRLSDTDPGHSATRAIRVTATDGIDADGVHVSWDPTPWRDQTWTMSFRVFRNTENVFTGSDEIHRATSSSTVYESPPYLGFEPAAVEYFDQGVQRGKHYYYWVIGEDGGLRSGVAAGEPGHAK